MRIPESATHRPDRIRARKLLVPERKEDGITLESIDHEVAQHRHAIVESQCRAILDDPDFYTSKQIEGTVLLYPQSRQEIAEKLSSLLPQLELDQKTDMRRGNYELVAQLLSQIMLLDPERRPRMLSNALREALDSFIPQMKELSFADFSRYCFYYAFLYPEQRGQITSTHELFKMFLKHVNDTGLNSTQRFSEAVEAGAGGIDTFFYVSALCPEVHEQKEQLGWTAAIPSLHEALLTKAQKGRWYSYQFLALALKAVVADRVILNEEGVRFEKRDIPQEQQPLPERSIV